MVPGMMSVGEIVYKTICSFSVTFGLNVKVTCTLTIRFNILMYVGIKNEVFKFNRI